MDSQILCPKIRRKHNPERYPKNKVFFTIMARFFVNILVVGCVLKIEQ